MLNDQSITSPRIEPWRSPRIVHHQRCSVKKGILKTFANFTGKHLCWATASHFNNVVDLQACNFKPYTEAAIRGVI